MHAFTYIDIYISIYAKEIYTYTDKGSSKKKCFANESS